MNATGRAWGQSRRALLHGAAGADMQKPPAGIFMASMNNGLLTLFRQPGGAVQGGIPMTVRREHEGEKRRISPGLPARDAAPFRLPSHFMEATNIPAGGAGGQATRDGVRLSNQRNSSTINPVRQI